MAVSRSLGSRFGAPLLLAAVAALGTAGCGEDADSSAPVPVPQPTPAQFDAAGLGQLPVAPDSARVDLTAPPFSNPTEVTNPLFPISELHSAVLNGGIDGKPFHTETTLLPYTRTIEWAPGQTVETRISQYMAFLDGRLQEVALDTTPRPTTGRSGTSARTSPTTTRTASSPTPRTAGSPARTARRR